MPISTGYQALLAQANARIKTISVEQAKDMLHQADVQFVDIRDVRELQRTGKIAGAFHAPRGMLEFWVDPASPYHKPLFAQPLTFVLYCQSGWRSALATDTLKMMGMDNVCHIEGGFSAWQQAGGTTEKVD